MTRTINQKRLITNSRLHKTLKHKTMRKRLVRISLVTANAIVLGIVAFIVISGSHANSLGASGELSDNAAANPVDGQTSYDIAANVARMADLPESTAINNQAQSAQVAVAVTANDSSFVEKPQIVYTALKSREDIQTYVAESGDTIASIAQKFGITSNSILWSNNISGTTVSLGTKLVIPPINGIVYTVKQGDTIQSLATEFNADPAQITAYNDAELAGISTGEQILIPNGQVQQKSSAASGGSFLAAGSFTPEYGGGSGGNCAEFVSQYPCLYGNNGYDFGWCTWYVASRISMPSNWGNASTWAYYAALSGWTVSRTPVVGAIVQTSEGDHVGYVEQVSADGSQIIYSDMNGLAGWGRRGVSGWVSATNGFDGGRFSDVEYIYR